MFNFQLFLSLLVTLFVVIDPLGNVPIFISKTKDFSIKQSWRISIMSAVYAFLILCLFAVGGNAILKYMGVSISSIEITGGLILIIIAFQMMLGLEIKTTDNVLDADTTTSQSLAIMPFAFPLLAGPGTIVTVLTSLQKFEHHDFTSWLCIAIAVLVILSFTTFLFGISKMFAKHLNTNVLTFLTKIIGLLLAAIAISMIGDGIYAFIQELVNHS